MQKEISLVIPAYNEVDRIKSTINEAIDYFKKKSLSYEIIVAADGNDGTRETVQKMMETNPNIMVLGSEKRSGKGRGIREAVYLATGEIIGFTDADNKTSISELDNFLPFFNQGYDLVIGSRASDKSVIENPQPIYRRIGSKVFKYIMQVITGLYGIQDTQCGFKFFTNESAKTIFRDQQIDGYMIDVEVLLQAKLRNCKIAQVPIHWRDDGDSRLNLIAGNLQNMKDLFRIRFMKKK